MKIFGTDLSITEFGVAHVVGSIAGDESVIVSCISSGVIVIAPSRVFNGLPIGSKCRIEIHSIDDPPWPAERPEGWGEGWWCEVQRSPEKSFRGICVVDDSDGWATVVVPEEASVWELPVDQITGYGPRAEAGG